MTRATVLSKRLRPAATCCSHWKDDNFFQVWSNVQATGDAELIYGSHNFYCNFRGADGSAAP